MKGPQLGAAFAATAMVATMMSAAAANPSNELARTVFASQPIVVTGAQLTGWSAGPEVTARVPSLPTNYPVFDTQGITPAPLRSACYQAHPSPDVNGYVDNNHTDHNCFQPSQLPIRTLPGRTGVPPDSLRGYRFDGHRFVQIPFQVDTKWQHYVSNNASGFAFYSGTDAELTYTFDREGFRFNTNAPFRAQDPAVVCRALPAGGVVATADPNHGLIDTDELVFMARDAGGVAPQTAPVPPGIVATKQVLVVDPASGLTRYVYIMESGRDRTGQWAVAPAYTATTSPYVRYEPDNNADMFVYSQSSYSDYGNAPKGPVCTPAGLPVVGKGFKRLADGALVLDPKTFVQRRPLDTATVLTPRYRFRYDGRLLYDDLRVSPDDRGLTIGNYGPSIIDRSKGRAFQQSPGGKTPCCGYEDEQNNWGGSSVVMGTKVGPVRTIRVTWGSDSGTNVMRTDVFYAYGMNHEAELRVHPIPPLDGIYTQWDMAAGRVTTYFNPYHPTGIPITGINPALYGDTTLHVGPDGFAYSSNDTVGRALRRIAVGSPNDATCNSDACVHGSFNLPDVTLNGLIPTLSWEEMTGPAGTLIEKYTTRQITPGAALAAVEAVPYYVDDSCFDDGTGANPGPHLAPRSPREPLTWGYDAHGVPVAPAPPGAASHSRRCWNHNADGSPYNLPGTATFDRHKPARRPDPPPDPTFSPQGDIRYLQGDIATHGIHFLFNLESDNVGLTVPLTEVDASDSHVILPPNQPNVGDAYTQPLVTPPIVVVS